MPGYYDASYSNTFSYAQFDIPTIEGGDIPESKMYGIFTNPSQLYDQYTGPLPADLTIDIGSSSGSGIKIGDEVGENPFSTWCNDPTEANPATSAGFALAEKYQTAAGFGIVYIPEPNISANLTEIAPTDLTERNEVQLGLRNMLALLKSSSIPPTTEPDFSDFIIGDASVSAADIAVAQQWIIDEFQNFVSPNKIATAAGMTINQVQFLGESADSADHLSIGGVYINNYVASYSTAWEYFCKVLAGLTSDGKWGFSYAVDYDSVSGLPTLVYPDGERVCQADDIVTKQIFLDLATAIDVLRAVHHDASWTANELVNTSEGESTSLDLTSFADAKAEAIGASIFGTSNESPRQVSTGGYDPIPDSSSSSVDSSSLSS